VRTNEADQGGGKGRNGRNDRVRGGEGGDTKKKKERMSREKYREMILRSGREIKKNE